jgi:hypothetical protein
LQPSGQTIPDFSNLFSQLAQVANKTPQRQAGPFELYDDYDNAFLGQGNNLLDYRTPLEAHNVLRPTQQQAPLRNRPQQTPLRNRQQQTPLRDPILQVERDGYHFSVSPGKKKLQMSPEQSPQQTTSTSSMDQSIAFLNNFDVGNKATHTATHTPTVRPAERRRASKGADELLFEGSVGESSVDNTNLVYANTKKELLGRYGLQNITEAKKHFKELKDMKATEAYLWLAQNERKNKKQNFS